MGCKIIVFVYEILKLFRVVGFFDECVIECRGCYYIFNYIIRKICGDLRNIVYDG